MTHRVDLRRLIGFELGALRLDRGARRGALRFECRLLRRERLRRRGADVCGARRATLRAARRCETRVEVFLELI